MITSVLPTMGLEIIFLSTALSAEDDASHCEKCLVRFVSSITHCLANMFNFYFSRVYLLAEIQRFVHFSFTEVITLLETGVTNTSIQASLTAKLSVI